MVEESMSKTKTKMESAISAFQRDLGSLRTGRANVSLLDPVMVDAYGSKTPLNQVANVSAPESKLITVQVWDKSLVGPVDKSIRDSGLGLNPVVDGQHLRIPLPDLNEERRLELAKIARDYAENARVAVRHVRRDALDDLKRKEKDKEIGQDQARGGADRIQKLTDEMIGEIDSILSAKESDIMQV